MEGVALIKLRQKSWFFFLRGAGRGGGYQIVHYLRLGERSFVQRRVVYANKLVLQCV